MADLQIGDVAPDFTLPTHSEEKITLSALKGKNVILYFYPKDDTPGCTKESCEFRDEYAGIQSLDAEIIGISKDTVKSHEKFATKYDLGFPLGADTEGKTCTDYGVIAEKSMFGKKYMGIERTTFLINKDGKIAKIWPKVKVSGHVAEVKKALEELSAAQAA